MHASSLPETSTRSLCRKLSPVPCTSSSFSDTIFYTSLVVEKSAVDRRLILKALERVHKLSRQRWSPASCINIELRVSLILERDFGRKGEEKMVEARGVRKSERDQYPRNEVTHVRTKSRLHPRCISRSHVDRCHRYSAGHAVISTCLAICNIARPLAAVSASHAVIHHACHVSDKNAEFPSRGIRLQIAIGS